MEFRGTYSFRPLASFTWSVPGRRLRCRRTSSCSSLGWSFWSWLGWSDRRCYLGSTTFGVTAGREQIRKKDLDKPGERDEGVEYQRRRRRKRRRSQRTIELHPDTRPK